MKSSEAECLFDLDFFEENHFDALFSSMQLRFIESQTVALIHDRSDLSDSSTDQFNIIARETIFIPAGQEAVILGELLTRSFPEKTAGILNRHPHFARNTSYWTSVLCESEQTMPARLIDPVEGATIYKGTSLRSFSAVGSAEKAAMKRVIADFPDHPQGQVPDKYDVEEVMKRTKSFMDPQIQAQFAQLLHALSDSFSRSKWGIGNCDFVQHRMDLPPGSKPVNLPNRRMPIHFKEDLRQKIDKTL